MQRQTLTWFVAGVAGSEMPKYYTAVEYGSDEQTGGKLINAVTEMFVGFEKFSKYTCFYNDRVLHGFCPKVVHRV